MKKLLVFLLSILTLSVWALADKYPDAAVILLSDREVSTYQSDGTAETADLCRYRIMNYDGLLQMRTLDFHFNSTYGNLQVTALSIEKPDGRKIILDPAKLGRISIEPSQMQSRIYDPAQKLLSVTVPGLEIGDTLTVGVKRQLLKPRIPGQWSDICVLQADFPILDYHYTINAPAEKPLQSITIKNQIPGTVSFSRKTSGDRIIYSWRAKNVPQAIPEPAMPALYTCCQRVLTSTVKNWQEISRWYDKLCAPRLAKVNDAMRQKVAGLTAGKTGEMAKITALFQFVSQQIRYTGITDEEHAPGYEPHDVCQTFDRRHGVCRDKAALLVAMLRLADIQAYPVLFMSGTPKDEEVPNIYFNHAIVTAVVNGKYILMDPTFETTRELLPSYMAGDSFLVAKPDGDILRKVPPVPAENNLLTVNTAGNIDFTGTFSGEISLHFTGTYDQMYRSAFSEWTPGERQEFFASRLQKLIPGAVIEKLTVTPANVRDMSVPLAVKISFAADNFIGTQSGSRIFAVPRLARSFGMLDSLYNMTGLAKRQFPLRALPRAVKESSSVTFPENISVESLPPAVQCGKKGLFRFTSAGRTDKNTLHEEHFFAIDSMLFAPAEYPELKKAITAADRAWRNLPFVKRSLDLRQANSVLLEHREEFLVNSAHEWENITTVRRKILNYAGMSEFSELRIPYIDTVDSVEITGSVTAPDGTEHTLAAKELNRMDVPGAAAMPRYPRLKIAVASFPNVVPGSIIGYTVKRRIRKRAWFAVEVPMQNYTPALKRTVSFAGAALNKTDFSGSLDCKKTSGSSGTVYEAENIPALPVEIGVPELAYFAPTAIADGKFNEKEVLTAINARLQKKTDLASPETAALAKKLAAGKDPKQAINAIVQYVARRVREVNYPFYYQWAGEFFAPQRTLADGYGSSADRAILLAAMLKAVGVKYDFALSTAQAIPENSPRYNFAYDYALVLLYLPEYGIFLNDHGLHGTLGARRHAGSFVLFLTPRPQWKLQELSNIRKIYARVNLDKSGDAGVTVRFTYGGKYFEPEAERFAKFTPEMRKRHFENLAASISPAAKVISASAAAEQHLFVVKLELDIPGFAVRSGKYVSCDLPGYVHIRNIYSGITGQKRKMPFLRPENNFNYICSVKVPESWQLVRRSQDEYTVFAPESKENSAWLVQRSVFNRCRLLFPAEFAADAKAAEVVNKAETGKIIFITE